MSLVPLWQLIVAGGIQVVTIVFWLATLSNRVKNIEKRQDEHEPIFERVVKLETLVTRLETLEKKLDTIIENQLIRLLHPNRRGPNTP